MKSNVDQVHRYLTAYLAAGGHFPERLNSKVWQLSIFLFVYLPIFFSSSIYVSICLTAYITARAPSFRDSNQRALKYISIYTWLRSTLQLKAESSIYPSIYNYIPDSLPGEWRTLSRETWFNIFLFDSLTSMKDLNSSPEGVTCILISIYLSNKKFTSVLVQLFPSILISISIANHLNLFSVFRCASWQPRLSIDLGLFPREKAQEWN